MKQVVGDFCIYVISFIFAATFMLEIFNWMMTI